MGQKYQAGRFDGMTTQLLPDTDTTTDTDLSVLESLDFEIPCDTDVTADNPEHAADVYATFSCGHGAFLCADHANATQDALAMAAALAATFGVALTTCTECGFENPTIVLIQPIESVSSDAGHSGNSGRAV